MIEIAVAKDEKQLWASFTARGPGAEALSNLSGWAFQLPEWRQTALVPTVADLMSSEPAK
jgi:hypothetical protein